MPYRNRLLASLSEVDRTLIRRDLEAVDLPLDTVLADSGEAMRYAYFIESGLCSVVGPAGEGARVEIGLIGRDGIAGMALILGAERTPYEIFMQIGGLGHRIAAPALREALERSPALRGLLLRYIQTFLVQTAQTALANAIAPAEERLARWLLMYHDREDVDDLAVTHAFLSMMLGVRRPTVTVAIHTLEGARLIRARRGRIRVLDRAGLEEAAGETYGVAEAEYERLIGPLRRAPAVARSLEA